MEVSKKRYVYSKDEGDRFENQLKDKLKHLGFRIKNSTKKQDMYEHIDFFVNGFGVDAKANRHLECIWLETKNINGNKGWLKGKAFYIIFEIIELNCYSVFRRDELLNYALTFKEYTENKNDFYKIYTRKKWNKKDEIIKVKYNDIKKYELQRILK
jgi:hypothetical protein